MERVGSWIILKPRMQKVSSKGHGLCSYDMGKGLEAIEKLTGTVC